MIKQILSVILVCAFTFNIFNTSSVFANESSQIPRITVNGVPVQFDPPPIMERDTWIASVDVIARHIGATVENNPSDFRFLRVTFRNRRVVIEAENNDFSFRIEDIHTGEIIGHGALTV